jgi:hypothetical protein
VSQYRHRPRRLNVRPLTLDRRLQGYAAAIASAGERPVGLRQQPVELGVRVDWFRVVSESVDDLVCTRRGGDETVRVAKPPDLQGAVGTKDFGGQTHEITPAYVSSGTIWGVSLPGGGGQVLASGRPYEWLDLNRDARAWARTPT